VNEHGGPRDVLDRVAVEGEVQHGAVLVFAVEDEVAEAVGDEPAFVALDPWSRCGCAPRTTSAPASIAA